MRGKCRLQFRPHERRSSCVDWQPVIPSGITVQPHTDDPELAKFRPADPATDRDVYVLVKLPMHCTDEQARKAAARMLYNLIVEFGSKVEGMFATPVLSGSSMGRIALDLELIKALDL